MSFEILRDEVDDIISSGYEWSDWHERNLTKLFEKVSKKEAKEFFNEYYGDLDQVEGVTGEELSFMAKLCGIKNLKITFD